MVTVKATAEQRSQIVELTNIFEARILSVGVEALTVSLDGSPSAIDDFMKALHPYGIVESQRTGLVALPKLDHAEVSSASSNTTHSSQGKAR
jgi:acetolactate synthase-1/3 small subunit